MVSSYMNAETLKRSGVVKPVLVAGLPCDPEVFEQIYDPYRIENIGGRTVFYNICQLSTKKGIDILLRAYFAAFAHSPDDVLLVLKTYIGMSNRDPQKEMALLKQYIQNVKDKTRIPAKKWPPVLPIMTSFSDDELHGLHTGGDAYVCASRAEGWCIPVFEALSHGKTVISHTAGGLNDFVSKDNALIYGGMPTLFYDMPHPDPLLFTGLEQCFEPSPAELALVMQRFHYLKQGAERNELNEERQKEWNGVLTRRENAKILSKKYDYRRMSGKIVEQLISAFDSWKEDGSIKFREEEDNS